MIKEDPRPILGTLPLWTSYLTLWKEPQRLLITFLGIQVCYIPFNIPPGWQKRKCNPRVTNGVSNATRVFWVRNLEIVNIFYFHRVPGQKWRHFRLSKFQKAPWVVNYESWTIFSNFDLWLMYESNVCDMYIIYSICYDSNFCDDFYDDKNFENQPTQKLKFRISLECVGVKFFWLDIRIKHKISYWTICIYKWFISKTPTQRRFQVERFVYAHAINCSTY